MSQRRRLPVVLVALLAWGCGGNEEEGPAPSPEYATPAPPSYARLRTAVPVPTMPFTEIAATAGLDFVHFSGATGHKWMPETMGAGVAFDDLDGDGDADIVLVNGTWWPEPADSSGARRQGEPPTSAVYSNDGMGQFTDVTRGSGLDVPVQGMGITAADYDADGDTDLYVTTLGPNLLLQQRSAWQYAEVAPQAGVEGSTWTDEEGRSHPEWSTSATWVDVDDDGLADLFVANYVQWSPENDLYFSFDGENKSYATPPQYKGSTPRLYRNLGDGHFEEITEAAGVLLPNAKSMGVAVADFDDDGRADLVVTNDTQPNFLLHNVGGRFEEVGMAGGIGYDESGRARAGMGVDVALLHDDAAQTIGIGNFSREALSLYRQTQPQATVFLDVAGRTQLVEPTLSTLTFGLRFVDIDLDGRQDLMLANGHIEPDINAVQKEITYAQPPQLFWNDGEGHLVDASAQAGAGFSEALVGRGLAVADLEGDGDADVLLATNAGRPRLYRNDVLPAATQDAPHVLAIELQGTAPSTDALGAIVEVRSGGGRQRQQVRTGSSYMSHSQRRLLFGLGEAATADRVTIRWPGERVTHLDNVSAGFLYRVNVDGITDRSVLTGSR
ncbi:MAG: CRTAC1 family protein [Gemmatimonadetes bacterium]|nr:CRTAC1 family protein [Gemmatimonadota bacterium]